MKRPRGVTLIAVFYFLKAAWLLIIALTAWMHVGGSSVSGVLTPELHVRNPGTLAMLAVFAPVFAVVAVVIGFGVLWLQNWARWAVLLSNGFALARWVMALIGILVFTPSLFPKEATPVFMIGGAMSALIVWYLLQFDAKRAFGEPDC